MLAAVEAERGGEQLLAEALGLELGADEMDGGDEILEVRVANDEPLEPVRVRAALDLGARLTRGRRARAPHLVGGEAELACRERLVDDGRRAARLQAELDVERHPRGREREELVEVRAP